MKRRYRSVTQSRRAWALYQGYLTATQKFTDQTEYQILLRMADVQNALERFSYRSPRQWTALAVKSIRRQLRACNPENGVGKIADVR